MCTGRDVTPPPHTNTRHVQYNWRKNRQIAQFASQNRKPSGMLSGMRSCCRALDFCRQLFAVFAAILYTQVCVFVWAHLLINQS